MFNGTAGQEMSLAQYVQVLDEDHYARVQYYELLSQLDASKEDVAKIQAEKIALAKQVEDLSTRIHKQEVQEKIKTATIRKYQQKEISARSVSGSPKAKSLETKDGHTL